MSALRLKSSLGALLLSALMTSCAFTEPSPVIEISPDPIPSHPPSPANDQYQRLLNVVGESAARREAVQDVLLMLKAKDHESRSEWDLAVQSWLEALKHAHGRFGRKAFEGWATSYSRILGKKADAKVLAKVLLTETKQGKKSPYLLGRGLFRHEALETELARFLDLPREAEEEVADLFLPKKGIPSEDPLLERSAKSYCKAAAQGKKPGWEPWLASLERPVAELWRAKVATCEGHFDQAVNLYKNVVPSLSRKPETATLAVHAAENLVALYRAKGSRDLAADAYLVLMKSFDQKGVNNEAYGESPADFLIRKINTALWAARYRAMVGDYENGRQYVQQASDLIAKTYSENSVLSLRQRGLLVELKAECYHVLAFRIAVEEKDYATALAMNNLGLQIPHLKADWRYRFQWFAGIYEYLGGNIKEAVRRWEVLLADVSGDSLKPQIFYWLARSYKQLGDEVKSKFYAKALTQDFPLHFYTIVAPQLQEDENQPNELASLFGSAGKIRKILETEHEYDIGRFKRHRKVGPLLFRAEILVAADAEEFAGLAARELWVAARKTFRLRSNHDAFVYLSRLLYRGHEYPHAISLTDQIVGEDRRSFWEQYKEQLFIGYPRPYSDIYERHASKYYVDREILYAVSRQESKFAAEVKSGAGAFGVMQLIPPTARRFAEEEKVNVEPVDEKLLQPEINIQLGTAYLRFLSRYYKGDMAAVFGAYNAGEYVMDTWLTRRAHDDNVMWIELIPYSETKHYVKNVLRNLYVYRFIFQTEEKITAMNAAN